MILSTEINFGKGPPGTIQTSYLNRKFKTVAEMEALMDVVRIITSLNPRAEERSAFLL
jgi:hypothetical protein